jgi:two-component system, cell cycle sensor histidine kinase and response regulator CckA
VRFLIVDDSPTDRELVVRRLKREFPDTEFIQVGRADQLEQTIQNDKFDIVLTDYQLNWTNGLEVMNRVKALDADIPVLMVTGTGSEEIAVEGLRNGLSNYILKQHLDRLPQAIRESLQKIQWQKQYEQAIAQLRLSEERYREIFEQSLAGIYVCTSQGEMVTCNSAFAHIFGFSSIEQVMQQDMRLLYPSIEHYTDFTNLLIQTRRLEYHEIEMKRSDGAPIYVVENVLGTFGNNGELLEIKGFIFDNTERKKLADQLQQAQRLESVGLLVSGIAHDFNNMLGGILGYTTRGLARVTQSHPLYDNLYHIRDIANRAAKMTHQLLAFSRRQVLEQSDVNLNVVVENLLSFLGKLLEDHIEIDFVPGSDLKTVHVDYAQIEQVLMNLCVNAHDAMPNGGKLTICTFNVERRQELEDGEGQDYPYICLSVEDTGTGMSEDVRSHIFEPFFTTKEIGKGTGLGLSMVHGIVGQHNGYIDVESVLGKGTKFSIYLPTTENPPQQSLVTPEDDYRSPVQGGSETILVVEDDPDLRCLMEEALGEYGYKVMSAADGSEGLKLFKEYPAITLVVSDLVTPKMRGKDLYDKIHEISADTKFLFVSGYQANQISQNFVLDKGFEFLQKPFDLDDLAGKVREILG